MVNLNNNVIYFCITRCLLVGSTIITKLGFRFGWLVLILLSSVFSKCFKTNRIANMSYHLSVSKCWALTKCCTRVFWRRSVDTFHRVTQASGQQTLMSKHVPFSTVREHSYRLVSGLDYRPYLGDKWCVSQNPPGKYVYFLWWRAQSRLHDWYWQPMHLHRQK